MTPIILTRLSPHPILVIPTLMSRSVYGPTRLRRSQLRDGMRRMAGIVSGARVTIGLTHLSMNIMRSILAFRKEKVRKVSQAREEKGRKGARPRAIRDRRGSSAAIQKAAEVLHPNPELNLALFRTVVFKLTLLIVTVIPAFNVAWLRDT